MNHTKKDAMDAVAIDRFGGVETMKLRKLPVPEMAADEILIHVETAGVGVWDPFEREGGFAKEFGVKPKFPYVLGADGAGTVKAVGKDVRDFKKGDRVYAISLASPKGGFYAQYAAVKAVNAALIPEKLTTREAGAMAVDATTALQGLDDVLELTLGDSIIIIGASGGIGHMAVQLAKRMGARVLAIASRDDGVALAKKLGAEIAIDGHKDDLALSGTTRGSFDAALVTVGGEATERALDAVREGGRIAYPNGVEPAPKKRRGIKVQSYDGKPNPETFKKLNRLIDSGPFEVHVARTFPLNKAVDAQRALDDHYLGKLVLVPV